MRQAKDDSEIPGTVAYEAARAEADLIAALEHSRELRAHIYTLENRVEALGAALRDIARQHLSDEMDVHQQSSAAWEDAYDTIVGIARTALAEGQDK